jgi:ribose transport system substrate-binding protein
MVRFRTGALALIMVLAAVALAACGSSSGGASSTASASGGAAGTSSSSAPSFLTSADAQLKNYYAGTDRSLPTSAPKPKANMKVWVIACSMAAEGCANPANGAAAAGRKLGWQMTVQDGKLDPNVYNQLIRQAIAAKVNGIVLAVVDCPPVSSAITQATQAGIKVVGTVSLDCDNEYTKGKPEFSAQVSYCPQPTSDEAKLEGCYDNFLRTQYAGNMADYTIAKTGGRADVIVMQEDDTLEPRIVGDAYQHEMAACKTCTVHVIPFTGQDLVNGALQAKAAAAIARYPDATAIMVPYDAAGLLGVTAAVKTAAAQGHKLLMIGAEGLTGAIQQIKSGQGQDFATGAPSTWWGWAGVDALNRAFDGTPQVDEGIGVQAIDKTHNLPVATSYYNGNQKSHWEQDYLKIWGVK